MEVCGKTRVIPEPEGRLTMVEPMGRQAEVDSWAQRPEIEPGNPSTSAELRTGSPRYTGPAQEEGPGNC